MVFRLLSLTILTKDQHIGVLLKDQFCSVFHLFEGFWQLNS
jgi:hypothetical protein